MRDLLKIFLNHFFPFFKENKETFFDDPIAFLETLIGPVDDQADPDWKSPTDSVDEKVYRNMRPFIMLVERYRLPARQASMMWNASLLCNGNTDKSKLITHATILKLQARYGKEIVKERKAKLRPYIALEIDGKSVHEPIGHNKTVIRNFATVVGLEMASEEDPEPEVDYAGHFKSRETGLALANGTNEIIEDSGSKDTLLVTKSDGSPNNTSSDKGMHKVCFIFSTNLFF